MKGGFQTLLRRFCLETSILGLKYFYLYPDLFSRCFWGISLISVLFLASQMTIFLYKRFDEMPTRITIENQYEPMVNISYPAITICSPNQITLTAMKHLNRTLVDGNRTLDLIAILPQLLGFYTITEVNVDSLKNLEDLLLVNRYYATEILSLVPQSCDDFLKLCYLDSVRYPKCKGLFNPILTKDGMCCIFNSMYAYRNHRRNEKMRHFVGYSGTITGILSGLTVVTDYNPDDAVDGTIINAGALKVMVSETTTFPVEDESNLIHANAESFHLLNPIYTYCSREVSSLPSLSRNCYFPDEKWLSHFQHYRRSDCEVLCAAKDIERSCNCFPPYLPHARNICNITSIACIVNSKVIENSMVHDSCNCQRDCESFRYRIETSVGNLDGLKHLMFNPYSEVKFTKSTSILHFFFTKPVYVKQKQETVMSLITLSSNLGGVFGLCLGCSAISVMEIIFYTYAYIRNKIVNIKRKYKKKLTYFLH